MTNPNSSLDRERQAGRRRDRLVYPKFAFSVRAAAFIRYRGFFQGSVAGLLASAILCIASSTLAEEFPRELTQFVPGPINPVFGGEGPGHWDVKIRERGWILREGETYHLWFTGYDGTREGVKHLGYATSPDGVHWTRDPHNPIYGERWVEDVMVVKQGDTYFMFAEGENDHAQLLTSKDKVHWTWNGFLDVRTTDGKPIEKGPYGTPTAWFENGRWYLFYERRDLGVWLAKSSDLKVFVNVQDTPVLTPGPDEYDRKYIALNQIIKYQGRYYACYHGSPGGARPSLWSSNLATSPDLVHWKKYPENPFRPLRENKSSNLLIDDGKQFRLYTMHESVWVYFPPPGNR